MIVAHAKAPRKEFIMKILIVTNSYPPEIRSTSHLMYELAHDLNEKGHETTVLTSFPGYNLSDPSERDGIREIMDDNGVQVLRARTMPLKKVGFVKRGIAEMALPLNFYRLLKRAGQTRFDAVWVFSPPLPLALLGAWIKRNSNAPLLLNAQDIFPQNGIDLGIITQPAVIKWYEFMERMAYRLSDFILVHSEKNRGFLLERKRVPKKKVIVQYNWVDMAPFERAQRTGRFRKRFGLEDKIVVLFGGVMGPSQGLEVVIEMAEAFRDDPSLAFLLVGDGYKKPELETAARERGLNNVWFGPFVSREEYPYLVKDADIGLTSLGADVKTPVVPGKIQGYMAAGIPILGILNKESDGHTLIRKAGAGISVNAGDIPGAIEALTKLRMSAEFRQRMGAAGHAFAKSELNRSKCVDSILGIMKRKVQSRGT